MRHLWDQSRYFLITETGAADREATGYRKVSPEP